MKEIKIIIIHDNKEIIRNSISVSTEISVIKSYFEKMVKAGGINPDSGQVTVWVNETHLYVAYRRLITNMDNMELIIMKNNETFNFVVDEAGMMYAEDIGGIGYRIDTFSDFVQACGIE